MIEDSLLRAAIECVRAARRAARTALGRPLRIGIEIRWRLGDEIMAVPIYDGIKQKYPTCHLTVWCNHPDVLIDNPHVDRVLGPQYGPRVFDVDRYILLRGAPRHRFRIDHYAARAGVPTPQRDPQLYYNDWSSDRLAGAGIAGKSFVAVSTGATWETKRWPIDHWKALCESLTADGHT
ncbi:MAG: glycosyltransferase family 9 protein, partial [Candidatus Hydrogenedentes bacterium]|nr:glycosyltransferase family 9 protein [Candidatus Hydrogenedentota bacterium]